MRASALRMKRSLFSLPRAVATAKPAHIQMPSLQAKKASPWPDRPSTYQRRLAPSWRHAHCDHFADAADGIAIFANLFDQGDHAIRCTAIRTANDIGFNLIEGYQSRIGNLRNDIANLLHVQPKTRMPCMASSFLAIAPAAPGTPFRGAGSASAPKIAETELGIESEIGVAGAVFFGNIAVILTALILIAKENPDRRAVGAPRRLRTRSPAHRIRPAE